MNFIRHGVFSKLALAALCTFALAGCASTQGNGPRAAGDAEIHDPLEGLNRGTFAFNNALDKVLLKPVAKGYRYVTPQPVRTGVRNFLRNLKSPVNMANQLLQGDMKGLGNDTLRFVVNSTVGLGGLIDVAGMEGFEYEQEDFGQTLAKWGMGHGFYLVVPIVGPSSLRDGTGLLVDSLADPLNIYLTNTDQEEWIYARLGLTVISSREELIEALDDLEKNSLDYYASMRSAYFQRREALVADRTPGSLSSVDIPNYE